MVALHSDEDLDGMCTKMTEDMGMHTGTEHSEDVPADSVGNVPANKTPDDREKTENDTGNQSQICDSRGLNDNAKVQPTEEQAVQTKAKETESCQTKDENVNSSTDINKKVGVDTSLQEEREDLNRDQEARGSKIVTRASPMDKEHVDHVPDSAARNNAAVDYYDIGAPPPLPLKQIKWFQLVEVIRPYRVYHNILWVKALDAHHYVEIRNVEDFMRYAITRLSMLAVYDKDDLLKTVTAEKARKAFLAARVDPVAIKAGDDFEGHPQYLPLRDQVVRVKQGKIKFFSYDQCERGHIAFNYCIDACYDEAADSTYFEKFLSDYIGEKKDAHLRYWELHGDLFFEDNTSKAIVCVYGVKGNEGKTTESNMIQELVLPKGIAVCEADAQRALSEHGAATFPFARILILTEANAEQGQREVDYKKRISGGDGFMINPKHATMVADKVKFKLLEICNHPAAFKDGTDDNAIKNRYQYVQVYPAPAEKRSPNLKRNLLRNRDYFVTQCVRGFARLQENNYQFTQCAKDDAVKDVVFGSTPVIAFLEDCCLENASGGTFTPANDVKDAYKKWAKRAQCHCKFKQVKQGLINHGHSFCRRRYGKDKRNLYGFEGIQLKHSEENGTKHG